MNTATFPNPREKTQVSVAAVARRADVSRSFLYDNPEAGAAVAAAMTPAGEHQTRSLAEQADEREATWRERALNAESSTSKPASPNRGHRPDPVQPRPLDVSAAGHTRAAAPPGPRGTRGAIWLRCWSSTMDTG